MTKPTTSAQFAKLDTTLVGGSPNKIEIPTQLKDVGYDVDQTPDCQHINWFFNNIYLWIDWLSKDGSVPPYLDTIDYIPGNVVVSDTYKIYTCKTANGPGTTVIDPDTGDVSVWEGTHDSVGPWINMTLDPTKWSTTSSLGYRLINFGKSVELRGIATSLINTNASPITNLPVGYRPLQRMRMPVIYYDASTTGYESGVCLVLEVPSGGYAAGDIWPTSTGFASVILDLNDIVFLGGITFPVT